ncbi:MAG: hypothetical protein IT577_23900 [Verrucomicrobiae bacterium]|nr:hypothetical protein [Verrucomicrobiae bacterium]
MRAAAPRMSGGLLTRRQKTLLVMLAREAWESMPGPRPDFESWRVEQAYRACGARISTAFQRHFLRLRAHFRDLAGNVRGAFADHLRSGTEPARLALYHLRKSCDEAGVEFPEYPRAIARVQFRAWSLEDLSEHQLWCLVYTLRARGRRRKKAFQTASRPPRTAVGHHEITARCGGQMER